MRISIGESGLLEYLSIQLNNFFPDCNNNSKQEISRFLDLILQRTEFCFTKINNKYFNNGKETYFNHLNADQYAMFLYFATNTLYKNGGNIDLCTKIFLLNRCLHGIDAYYEVELPDIFLFVHPIGTVLGRANYSNYFTVYQRCNIGSNNGVYPTLQEYIILHPGSSVLGNCMVGKNCRIAADSLLLEKDLADNCLYIGNPRDFIIKEVNEKPSIWL